MEKIAPASVGIRKNSAGAGSRLLAVALSVLSLLSLAFPGDASAQGEPARQPPFDGGAALSETPSTDPLLAGTVPAIRAPKDWARFLVMIWQYRTEARRDLDLYRNGGFAGFHIDRGAGQEGIVAFAREKGLPYYVDHAADKGFLHLTERTGVDAVMRKKGLIPRPRSLADPKVMEAMKAHLARNIAVTREGPVVAYSFDDEIALGSFNSPAEVDNSPASVAGFQRWLEGVYPAVGDLNKAWDTRYSRYREARPISFEDIRRDHAAGPFSRWRLARWMDWRAYMDSQFASVLGKLTRYANKLDPKTPAGFVGGQQPSAFGGFDYEKLCRAVQFMEAYDIGGTNEILRSLWGGAERRPRVQTWFSRGDPRQDSWFLWYYLVHGNRGVIAWPDGGKQGGGLWFRDGKGLLPHLEQLAPTTREVQGSVSEAILSPDTRFDPDPIAVFYSMPSIRASWVTDVIPHGGTWPNRSSSLDNQCQSAAKNREAWFKLLEDCGFQYNAVTAGQVAADHLIAHGYRVLILNRALCLSDAEITALERFVAAGGRIIADHWAGLLDERGNGRALPNRIDALFGISREEKPGYFGGGGLCELNGEKYKNPYLERLEYVKATRVDGIVTVGELGQDAVPVKKSNAAGGGTLYLDRSPLEYWDNVWRAGPGGAAWRKLLTEALAEAGLESRVRVLDAATGAPVPLAETLFWRRGDRRIMAVVMNPTRQGSVTGLGEIAGVPTEPLEVTLRFYETQRDIRDLRAGTDYPDGKSVTLKWKPWEALVLEMATGE